MSTCHQSKDYQCDSLLLGACCSCRLAQKLAAMYYTCTKHTNSTNCDADTANNCQWVDISDNGMCISNPNDMWEHLLVCPGSVVSAGYLQDSSILQPCQG